MPSAYQLAYVPSYWRLFLCVLVAPSFLIKCVSTLWAVLFIHGHYGFAYSDILFEGSVRIYLWGHVSACQRELDHKAIRTLLEEDKKKTGVETNSMSARPGIGT